MICIIFSSTDVGHAEHIGSAVMVWTAYDFTQSCTLVLALAARGVQTWQCSCYMQWYTCSKQFLLRIACVPFCLFVWEWVLQRGSALDRFRIRVEDRSRRIRSERHGKMAERSKACDSSTRYLPVKLVSHLRKGARVRISLLSIFLLSQPLSLTPSIGRLLL